MGNPTNSNNKGGQPPSAPKPIANSPFVIGGTAQQPALSNRGGGNTGMTQYADGTVGAAVMPDRQYSQAEQDAQRQRLAAAGGGPGGINGLAAVQSSSQPAWGNYTMPGQPIGSGITKPTYNPGPGKDTLSTLLPGGVPAGVDRFGNNNTPVISGKTFIGTGNMPGQGYYVDSNSPEAMALNSRQSTTRASAAESPFSITGQQVSTQAPSTGTPYSGPLRQPITQPVTGTPGNAGLADILAQVQASKGARPPVGPAPSVYQPQPYKPYVPYDDSTAWGGSPSSVYGGNRTPLAEALARRNQTPEAPYYG